MRKLPILLILIITTISFAGDKTYKAKTKDNEVSDIKSVVVESIELVEKVDFYTIAQIDNQIAEIQQKISDYQNKIDYWETLKAEVLAEAEKVKLKE